MKDSTRTARAIFPMIGIVLCSIPACAQVLKGSAEPQRSSAVTQAPPANLRMITSEADYEKLAVQAHYVPVNGAARTIRNLTASSAQMSLFSQLSQQKQSANTDLMQIRAVRLQKTNVAVQPQTGMLNSRVTSAANTRTTATMPSTPSQIGPGTVQSGKTGVSRYATLPNNNTQISACPFANGQLAIGKMTGPGQAMTFTPIPEYNLYTIHGCNFGDAVAGNKAWIYTAGFHADFGIEEWSDSMIVLKLGENISGVGDLSNLTLVVHRADGKEAQAAGYKFYAARVDKPIMLKYVPPGWRKFDYSITGVHHWGWHPTLQDNSPVPTDPHLLFPADARNSTIYVGRGLSEKFSKAGTDYFDFSQLPSGWVVDSISWEPYPTNCLGVVTSREDYGQWNVNLNGSTVQVDWGDESCSGWVPPFFGYQDHTASTYSLQVFVKGPRGTDNLLPKM